MYLRVFKSEHFVVTSTDAFRSLSLWVSMCREVHLCKSVCCSVLSEVIPFSLLTDSKKEVRPWRAAVINALPQ